MKGSLTSLGCTVSLSAILASPLLQAVGQTASSTQLTPQSNASESGPTGTPYTLRVVTHEVVVEIVARDQNNNPVRDLNENDIQVYEIGKRSQRSLTKTQTFHLVDPALNKYQDDVSSGGFRITMGGGCAVATTFHYLLAFQPNANGWKSGYHEILITTSRPHVKLAYHHQYYVGETEKPEKPQVHNDSFADEALQQAACYHPDRPPSIALKARLVQTTDTDPLRYSLIVQPDSLAFASISNAEQPDQMRRVDLDYAACTFNTEGKPLNYLRTSAERVIGPEEYARVRVSGFSNLLNLPRQGDPALVRFVVRDRETGNLGLTDVPTSLATRIELTKSQRAEATKKAKKQTETDDAVQRAGTFGSILPKPNSLCGDVYELPKDTRMLPPDYGDLNAVGAIYTDYLNVPYGFLPDGIPGVTSRPEYFGIDYHGEFWVNDPGQYRFQMTTDDGARLYIDDHLLFSEDGVHSPLRDGHAIQLTAGRHTIHIPYFQETVHVALILKVKRPGENHFKVFDVRDFKQTTNSH
jgi:hypothetical protein